MLQTKLTKPVASPSGRRSPGLERNAEVSAQSGSSGAVLSTVRSGSRITPMTVPQSSRRPSFFSGASDASFSSPGDCAAAAELPVPISEVIDELQRIKLLLAGLQGGQPVSDNFGASVRAGLDRCVQKLVDHAEEVAAEEVDDPNNIIKRSLANKLNETKMGNQEDQRVAKWIENIYTQDYLQDADSTPCSQHGITVPGHDGTLSEQDTLVLEKFQSKFDADFNNLTLENNLDKTALISKASSQPKGTKMDLDLKASSLPKDTRVTWSPASLPRDTNLDLVEESVAARYGARCEIYPPRLCRPGDSGGLKPSFPILFPHLPMPTRALTPPHLCAYVRSICKQ